MKIRTDFVTNSSSSSFIAIKKNDTYNCIEEIKKFADINNSYIPFEEGNCEFGWEQKEYSDIHSRINYAVMQIYYAKRLLKIIEENKKNGKENYWIPNDETLKIMKNARAIMKSVFEETTGMKINSSDIENKIENIDAYIDHQSRIDEDFILAHVFESEETLKNFLFGDHSVIIQGNDNCGDEGMFNGLEKKYQNNDDYSCF